jgi:hypothetical protein
MCLWSILELICLISDARNCSRLIMNVLASSVQRRISCYFGKFINNTIYEVDVKICILQMLVLLLLYSGAQDDEGGLQPALDTVVSLEIRVTAEAHCWHQSTHTVQNTT